MKASAFWNVSGMPTKFFIQIVGFLVCPCSGLLYFFRNSKLTVNQVTVIVHKKFQGKEIRFIGMKERRQSALLRIAKGEKGEEIVYTPNKHSVFQKVPMQFIAISVQQYLAFHIVVCLLFYSSQKNTLKSQGKKAVPKKNSLNLIWWLSETCLDFWPSTCSLTLDIKDPAIFPYGT